MNLDSYLLQKRKLQDFDLEQSDDPHLAEASCPRHGLKVDIKKAKRDGHTAGQKPTKVHEPAQRMNWTQPVLWAQIDAAAKRAGHPWSPKEIVDIAQKMNPQAFKTLTRQVLGRWIDQEAKSRGVFQWKHSVLEEVKHGNAPGGKTTRRGILVSVKNSCFMVQLTYQFRIPFPKCAR